MASDLWSQNKLEINASTKYESLIGFVKMFVVVLSFVIFAKIFC